MSDGPGGVPASTTDLTAEWLASVVDGRVPGRVRSVTAERIGVGFGLDGEAYRLDVTLHGGAGHALVAKLTTAEGARHEARMYTDVLPAAGVRVPRFYGVQTDGERGVVVLEFVTGARQGDCLAGCTVEEAQALARAVAALQAPWWDLSAAEWPDWLVPEPRTGKAVAPESIDRCIARHRELFDAGDIALLRDLPARVADARSALDDHPTALSHRDLHLDNVMLDPVHGPVILDWPLARRGPAATDVGRLLVEALQPKDIPAGTGAVMDAYLEELERRGAGPYPRAKLREGIRLATLVLLEGTVDWAGAEKQHPAGSREAALPRNLARNCLTLLASS